MNRDYQSQHEKGCAVITGAARGLGLEIAKQLGYQGFSLALLDRAFPEGFANSHFSRHTSKLSLYTLDVSNRTQCLRTIKQISKAYSNITILVNNAGISSSLPFERISIDEFEAVMKVNFLGALYLTHTLRPHLAKSNPAHILFISSNFALLGFPGKTAYSASKGALNALANSLKTEYQNSGLNISIAIPPAMPTGIITNGGHIGASERNAEVAFLDKYGMKPEIAAERIVSAMLKGVFRIRVGWQIRSLDFLARFSPVVVHSLIGRFRERIPFFRH